MRAQLFVPNICLARGPEDSGHLQRRGGGQGTDGRLFLSILGATGQEVSVWKCQVPVWEPVPGWTNMEERLMFGIEKGLVVFLTIDRKHRAQVLRNGNAQGPWMVECTLQGQSLYV